MNKITVKSAVVLATVFTVLVGGVAAAGMADARIIDEDENGKIVFAPPPPPPLKEPAAKYQSFNWDQSKQALVGSATCKFTKVPTSKWEMAVFIKYKYTQADGSQTWSQVATTKQTWDKNPGEPTLSATWTGPSNATELRNFKNSERIVSFHVWCHEDKYERVGTVWDLLNLSLANAKNLNTSCSKGNLSGFKCVQVKCAKGQVADSAKKKCFTPAPPPQPQPAPPVVVDPAPVTPTPPAPEPTTPPAPAPPADTQPIRIEAGSYVS